MANTNNRVSVIIPCFNCRRTLRLAIDSLRNQSVPVLEIIIVDDGLSPAVEDIEGVKIIRISENKGVAFARNLGVKQAEGEIIVFVDADVVLDKNFIRNILFAYGPETSGVGGRLDDDGSYLIGRWRNIYLRQNFGDSVWERLPMLSGAVCSYRREVLIAAGGFDEGFLTNAEDVEIGIRLNQQSRILKYTPLAKARHLRRDSFPSLVKNMFKWYYWGYKAQLKHNLISRGKAGNLLKSLILECRSDLLDDILQRRNPVFAVLTCLNYFIKFVSFLLAVG